MRSNHWEYLAFMLFALGLALTVSGSFISVYYLQSAPRKPQYSGIQIPVLVAGVCLIILGSLAFRKYRMKKKAEAVEGELPTPPPFPPPPPPPPFPP